MTPPPVSRRTVLAATPGLALAATPASPSEAATGTSPAAPVGVDDYPRLDTLPFAHGVASGDPTPTRVIIWTRVTLPDRDPAGPPGANPRGSRPAVRWVVATDPALTTVVASGTQTATAERDWTVKVDVTGLRPATTYYYGFRLGAQRSMTGRTRTSTSGHLGRARLAVMSCQSYWSSRWAGLGHLARRNDIDLVIQADAPDEYKTYLHRSGRTGRAGRSGTVVTLITRQRRRKMTEMLDRAEIDAPFDDVRPGDDLIEELTGRQASDVDA